MTHHRRPATSIITTTSSSSSSLLVTHAKRKRRRKDGDGEEDDDDSSFSIESSSSSTSSSNDLPDFDLKEDEPLLPQKKKTTDPMAEDIGMISRRSSSSLKPARSVDQLIKDRALESKFVFDDSASAGGEELPDLAVIASSQRSSSDKKARKQQAIERAAAAASESEASSGSNILEMVPFFVDEKTGKVTALKMLEAGTWAGIGLLVAWEVYINSPLFDRAAPMAPVVY